MGLIKEFRDFAMRGNVVDMAVGIIIGAAFGTIVKTTVDKVIMPPIGYLTGGVDFADLKLVLKAGTEELVTESGETVAAVPEVAVYYGELINAIITFLIVAFVLFMIIKAMNKAQKAMEKEKGEEPPKGPAEDIMLLREIRDSLKKD